MGLVRVFFMCSTGSGKTAVIMMTPFITRAEKVLVITPRRLVRNQIKKEFESLRTLVKLGVVPKKFPKIKVFEAEHVITKENMQEIINNDVVIATPPCIKSKNGICIPKEMFDLVIFDEAHHIPAKTWTDISEYFIDSKQVLFTATPFRRDKKEINGKFLYTYTMKDSYDDGIFGEIEYIPVLERKNINNDILIAKETEKVFFSDKENGFEHKVMIRVASKPRAKELLEVYSINTKLKLEKIDSDCSYKKINNVLDLLSKGDVDGIICVDMLGEGFDFPNLKIAALHSPHKSLEVTLQFIGRFTRINGKNLGRAKFLAVPNEIEIESTKIYERDAVWSRIIHNMSDKRIEKEINDRKIISNFEVLRSSSDETEELSLLSIRPNAHSKIFTVYSDVDLGVILLEYKNFKIVNQYINEYTNSAVYILKELSKPKWNTSDKLIDIKYEVVIVYFDQESKLIHINSSIKCESLYKDIMDNIAGDSQYSQLSTREISRVYRDIEDMVFFNIGLKNGVKSENTETYRIISGGEVDKALSPSNGIIFRNGHSFGMGVDKNKNKVNIGCSSASKVWSSSYLKIPDYLDWCRLISKEIINKKDFKTNTGLDNIPKPYFISELPKELEIIEIDWGYEVYNHDINFVKDGNEVLLIDLELEFIRKSMKKNSFQFFIGSKLDNSGIKLEFKIDGVNLEYKIIENESKFESVVVDGREVNINEFFSEFPIIVYLNDFSVLEGKEYCEKNISGEIINPDWFTIIDWSKENIDITKEFREDKTEIKKSIHDYMNMIISNKAKKSDFVYYDHGTGEIADFIEARTENDILIIKLYHCKGSGGKNPGSRVGDVYEVCGQVVKSITHLNNKRFLEKLLHRSELKSKNIFNFRKDDVNKLLDMFSKATKVEYQIVIVQPGITFSKMQNKLKPMFVAANEFCRQNAIRDIEVICSK